MIPPHQETAGLNLTLLNQAELMEELVSVFQKCFGHCRGSALMGACLTESKEPVFIISSSNTVSSIIQQKFSLVMLSLRSERVAGQ